ncbi:sarcosine oxidase subunit alpha [Terrihabitans soli]|uniref:Sarcosine oxidase subunit alpha n=1 Tax=Terrihabitans soli TaxID=708113 RepID=A0A6S6QT97_9HYPH|nr:2Fe-2S iron-sulfur cluster-binding protein [Terrihabitans soli]BCJ90291.1 sarcosine oxidase subunit alpha [Terrihabitans soli]
MSRLPESQRFGRLLDRSKPLDFTFDGKRLKGFAGDTLASALLANDVSTVARSFKYHRPRGITGIGLEEPNAFVEIGQGAHRLSSQNAVAVPLRQGLAARSQNAWPSLRFDFAGVLDRARPLLPAGFQYKTFKWPLRAWNLYESRIRRLGGLGRVPDAVDTDRYEHVHAFADVLVIGGGIAGIAAAEAASAEGLKVILAETSSRLGGIVDAYDGRLDGWSVLDWTKKKVGALAASGNVHILTRTEAVGLYDHGLAMLVETLDPATAGPEAGNVPRQRVWKLRAKSIVLATGAHEKPLIFPENDRPGIMLATSARLYLRRYAIVPGKRIVIATTGDEGYRTAADLDAAGANITRIVDLRLLPDSPLFHITKSQGRSISVGSAPVSTRARGRRLSAVTFANRLTVDGPALRNEVNCDTLLISGGWAPMPNLAGHLGARLVFNTERGCFMPDELPAGLFVAGGANGHFDLGAAVDDGYRAGAAADAHVRGLDDFSPRRLESVDITQDDPSEAVGALPDISTPKERLRSFIDQQTDVTVGDMEIAAREGYGSPELVKRYTGMTLGVDQGKSVFAAAAAILPKLARTNPADAEHTTFRPPFSPVSFGAIAGARRGPLFRPTRATPLTPLFKDAIMEPAGQWTLPAAFPQPGEAREAAVRREVRAVRSGIGLFDASAGAKIEVFGRDALDFLEHLSATDLGDMAAGTSRYALFLNDAGFVMEDGVVARISEDRFLVATGITQAAPLLAWFERWKQQVFDDLDVRFMYETERWAQILLAGPRVPELLSRIPGDIDISQFTVDSFAEGEIFGTPARALASRYTAGSEVELSVASGYAPALWTYLLNAGQDLGVTRFGGEAMHRLRLEAGAFDLDRETDGTVTPFDLGLGSLVSSRKDFYVGRTGLERPALTLGNRRHLVGILMDDRALVPPPGTHLILDPEEPPPRRVVGHITSSGYSPTLRRSIALALVSAGEQHLGQSVYVLMSGDGHIAHIAAPDFLSLTEIPAAGDDADE